MSSLITSTRRRIDALNRPPLGYCLDSAEVALAKNAFLASAVFLSDQSLMAAPGGRYHPSRRCKLAPLQCRQPLLDSC